MKVSFIFINTHSGELTEIERFPAEPVLGHHHVPAGERARHAHQRIGEIRFLGGDVCHDLAGGAEVDGAAVVAERAGADGDRLDEPAVAEFLAAYRAVGGPVPPEEDDLIVPLIRAKRILEVLRAPFDRDPQWDHQLANLRAYAFLDAPAGPPSAGAH